MKSSHVRIVAPNIDISTPQGLATAFRHGATECLFNAEALSKDRTANLTGHYMVTFHAIELGLKAFLAKNGVTESVLRKKPYGHDLVSLYSEAVNQGLCISVSGIERTLHQLNRYHHKGAILRYNFSETRELPLCSDLLAIASALVNATK
jgi:hypothetical protein